MQFFTFRSCLKSLSNCKAYCIYTTQQAEMTRLQLNSPAILCTLTSVFAIPQVQGHLNELCDSGVTPVYAVSASTVSAQVTTTIHYNIR